MIRYTPESQLSIEAFKTPFKNSLSPDNRWVKLSKIVPWDKFAFLYISMMDSGFGRPGISPRVVLGALIIKHMEKLDDIGVIDAIQENVYMQYFVGLSEFSTKPVFEPSLFVEIRKRVGADIFDSLNVDLLVSISKKKDHQHKNNADDQEPKNKGKLQADATVADQFITYPTDTGLLNSSRKECQKMIDHLYDMNGKEGVKPRTYRKVMDKDFLTYSKKKNKSRKVHRKMTRLLLGCVKRNLLHIDNLLDVFEANNKSFPLSSKDQRMLWIIKTVYAQQKFMFDEKVKSHTDRIVSIHQPHVRAVPRGKTKAQIEFGSKLGVSLDQGFARIHTFSWDPYHEGKDLIPQVESYKKLHGYYPELVQVDKAYATRENRKWLSERGIRITATALGRRKKKTKETNYQKRKHKKEAAERNHIEGKFGQGKNAYGLNNIRATRKETSESWVACIFFIMNLINYMKLSSLSFILTHLCNNMASYIQRIMTAIMRIHFSYFNNTKIRMSYA
ncbi:MAG: IS5 family transposase [Candidatus Nitrosopelagicus sp.]|nr:IS5 family transposase [Candidatus Nitrosopelagicus sp.]